MHWSLTDVRELDEDEYHELVEWLLEQQDRQTYGADAVNVDTSQNLAADVKRVVRG